ncbi:MAG: ACP S-malonyltransferase [Muricoprocola sp.]
MSKIAFIFPGQGAQLPGMGKDFYEESQIAREIFDQGSEILGIDLKKICFEENELLNRTDYTQIAMTTACIAMAKEVMNLGINPDITAGLSLGEYPAIVCAGGMSFEDALQTVYVRGKLMHEATLDGSGVMTAILGLTGEQVKEVTDQIEGIYVANYNCPGQIVITGCRDAMDKACEELKKAGARRTMPLNVSGPFHSPYMNPAAMKLEEQLHKVTWKDLVIPYVANATAEIITDISNTPDLLKTQVCASVMWEQSIRNMIDWGVDVFVEIGPGKTLSRFMSRIDKKAQIYAIGSVEEMKETVSKLKWS